MKECFSVKVKGKGKGEAKAKDKDDRYDTSLSKTNLSRREESVPFR